MQADDGSHNGTEEAPEARGKGSAAQESRKRSPPEKRRECIARLSSVVTGMLGEGEAPALIMEVLTEIRRNLSLPIPRPHRLTVALVAASLLTPQELRQLLKSVKAQVLAEEKERAEIPRSQSSILVEERRYRGDIYRLELVRCNADSCRKCRVAPAHGPYWYLYGKRPRGETEVRRYIGKTLPPKIAKGTRSRSDAENPAE